MICPPMRFDLNLLPMYFPDVCPSFDEYFGQILNEVQLGEDLGFSCYWFTEHHFLLYGGPICNPAVFISAAAARTSTIRLGTAISIVPLRHPLQTAEDYAMADAISHGRLDFGVGRGNVQLDFDVYGINRAESRARFEEAMEVIEEAWSNERFSHSGYFWQLQDVSVYPKPTQKPHPRIWVAANSVDSGRWAGLRSYDLMTVAHVRPPEMVRPGVEAWKEALAERGDLPENHNCQLMIRMCIDEDSDKANEMAHYAFSRWDELASRGRDHFRHTSPAEMRAQSRVIYGNPDEVIQGIHRARQNFEFDTIAAVFNWGGLPHEQVMRSMRLFAKEVLPAFAD
jgi:alkanesulfonate monooxygenase SsuD/methylene tetrahydromethanopterin reductase-like flavin-dependent oxidoreductase (luciferase family)